MSMGASLLLYEVRREGERGGGREGGRLRCFNQGGESAYVNALYWGDMTMGVNLLLYEVRREGGREEEFASRYIQTFCKRLHAPSLPPSLPPSLL